MRTSFKNERLKTSFENRLMMKTTYKKHAKINNDTNNKTNIKTNNKTNIKTNIKGGNVSNNINTADIVAPKMVDSYEDFKTKNILYGEYTIPNDYVKEIIIKVIKAYTIDSEIIHDNNDWTIFYKTLYKTVPDYDYDLLINLLKKTKAHINNSSQIENPTIEYVLSSAMYAFKSQDAELFTRTINTFGRPLKLTEGKNTWLDNWSINGPCNALNFVFWNDYDNENIITTNNKKPNKFAFKGNTQGDTAGDNTDDNTQGNTAGDNTAGDNTAEDNEEKNTAEDNEEGNTQGNTAGDNTQDNIRNNEEENTTGNNIINKLSGGGKNNIITQMELKNAENDGYKIFMLKIVGIFRSFLIVNHLLPSNEEYKIITCQDVCNTSIKYFPCYYIACGGCNMFNDDYAPSIQTIRNFLNKYPEASISCIVSAAQFGEANGGAHWMALYFDNKRACLLCPQASSWRVFKDNGKLYNSIMNNDFATEYNGVLCQRDNCNCGVYSVLFVYSMILHNGNMKEAVKQVGVNATNISNKNKTSEAIFKVKDTLFGYQ